MRMEERDTEMWLQGAYIHEAMTVVMANMFSKKGAKKQKYRDMPYYKQKREEDIAKGLIELSEEEKAERVRKIFRQIDSQMSVVAQKRRDR